MVDFSLPVLGRSLRLVSDSGYCFLRLPLLGEAVFVLRLSREASRPRFAYQRIGGTGWRTLWLGKLQISHVFR